MTFARNLVDKHFVKAKKVIYIYGYLIFGKKNIFMNFSGHSD